MGKNHLTGTYFIIIFCFSVSLHANTSDVTSWTQDTLLKTLAATYQSSPKQQALVRQAYTNNAWQALNHFLGQSLSKTNQQSRPPHAIGLPIVVETGTVKNSHFFEGVQYWRVKQAIQLPHINQTVHFIALVILMTNGNFLITSLDMSVQ